LLDSAGNAVGAKLVFLDLLESDRHLFAEYRLAHTHRFAAKPQPLADMDIERMWRME